MSLTPPPNWTIIELVIGKEPIRQTSTGLAGCRRVPPQSRALQHRRTSACGVAVVASNINLAHPPAKASSKKSLIKRIFGLEAAAKGTPCPLDLETESCRKPAENGSM